MRILLGLDAGTPLIELAAQENTSRTVVTNIIKRLFECCRVTRRIELVKFARAQGWIAGGVNCSKQNLAMLTLLDDGFLATDAAQVLSVDYSDFINSMRRLMCALEAKNQVELLAAATEWGWLPTHPRDSSYRPSSAAITILQLAAWGQSTEEIAARTEISLWSVHRVLDWQCRAYGQPNLDGMLHLAKDQGWLEDEEER